MYSEGTTSVPDKVSKGFGKDYDLTSDSGQEALAVDLLEASMSGSSEQALNLMKRGEKAFGKNLG